MSWQHGVVSSDRLLWILGLGTITSEWLSEWPGWARLGSGSVSLQGILPQTRRVQGMLESDVFGEDKTAGMLTTKAHDPANGRLFYSSNFVESKSNGEQIKIRPSVMHND